MRIVVLGAGRVGYAMVLDLAAEKSFEITVADLSREALARFGHLDNVTTRVANLAAPEVVREVVRDHDLVVGAVPGPMGFRTVEAVIRAGVPMVDISFFEQDPFELDELAKERGVMVLTDCGVAPGCSNLILGRMERELDRVDRFSCYVGGLPTVRFQPYEYRAVFSPIDVIAEYTRPSRLVEAGEVVVREALSEVELLEFAGVGTLEAFNTDGLRSILRTCKVPHMKEKTMRYPGHAEKMRMLRDTGFFSEDPVRVGEVEVRPIDLTAALLFPAWKLQDGEEDVTVMRVEVEGLRDGRGVRTRFDLVDRYDRDNGVTSMARTTGYTCTAVVRAVAAGLYDVPGISPPELLGRQPGCFEFVLARLEERNVHFERSDSDLH